MTTPRLYQMLSRVSIRDPSFMAVDDRAVWYDGSISVVNDPNLLSQFGEKLLFEILDSSSKTYKLGVANRRVRIVAETKRDEKAETLIRENLNAGVGSWKRAEVTKEPVKVKKDLGFFEGYGVRAVDNPDKVFMMQPEYFDYLSSISGQGGTIFLDEQQVSQVLFYTRIDKLSGFAVVLNMNLTPSDVEGNIEDLF